jgi:ribonuclease BN (tRNA processing enzyme)
MNIKVLGAAGGEAPGQHLTGFLIDEEILLDAGTIGLKLDVEQQRKIQHVMLTHAHLDHVYALPFLLDNLIGRIDGQVNVYGHPEVLNAVQTHIFNNQIWPDFSNLPTPEKPIMKLRPLTPGTSFSVGEYTIESVAVKHSFAALAYIIHGPSGCVLFSGDTAPVDELWQTVKTKEKVQAIFIECSFSNSAQDMAKLTNHLCTQDVTAEIAKTGREAEIPVYLYHLKPAYLADITKEAQALKSIQVKIAKSGDEFSF